MQRTLALSLFVSVLIAGGLGFYGGVTYKKQQPLMGNERGSGFTGTGAPGPRGGRGNNANGGAGRLSTNGGGFHAGEIVSKDAAGLTLKLMDGGSKIVIFTSSTHIGKMSDGTIDDLKTGTNVMVNGIVNTDGSVTATNIQLRPTSTNTFLKKP